MKLSRLWISRNAWYFICCFSEHLTVEQREGDKAILLRALCWDSHLSRLLRVSIKPRVSWSKALYQCHLGRRKWAIAVASHTSHPREWYQNKTVAFILASQRWNKNLVLCQCETELTFGFLKKGLSWFLTHFSMDRTQHYKELRLYWQVLKAKTDLLSGYFAAGLGAPSFHSLLMLL